MKGCIILNRKERYGSYWHKYKICIVDVSIYFHFKNDFFKKFLNQNDKIFMEKNEEKL